MKIVIPIKEDRFVEAYLKLWAGNIGLTDMELKVMIRIIEDYRRISIDGVPEPYRSQSLFDPVNMQELAKSIELSQSSWNNYRAQLRDKGLIFGSGKDTTIDPKLIPQENITFNFQIS